jgi:hypothetical protein
MDMKDSESNLRNEFFQILSHGLLQRLSQVPQYPLSSRRENSK